MFADQNPLPPPDIVQVVDINNYVATQQLVFNWSSSLSGSCPSAHYRITSIGCGNCPISATSNHTICWNADLGHMCSFVVHSVACGVVGDPSNPVTVILKGNFIQLLNNTKPINIIINIFIQWMSCNYTVPNAPIVHSVPLYDHETTHLQSIHTMFEESVSKLKDIIM